MADTYYKAIRPDGTSFHDPTFRWVPETGPVEGIVVTHPHPHDTDPSGWLSVATVPTDCTGMTWPCRLLLVEPVEGHPVTAPLDDLPNKRAASAWRVVRELPATDALGPQGAEVAAIIERASRLTTDEARRLDAARDAARDAAWGAACGAACGLVVRDVITTEDYDILTRAWRTVIGPIHPEDEFWAAVAKAAK